MDSLALKELLLLLCSSAALTARRGSLALTMPRPSCFISPAPSLPVFARFLPPVSHRTPWSLHLGSPRLESSRLTSLDQDCPSFKLASRSSIMPIELVSHCQPTNPQQYRLETNLVAWQWSYRKPRVTLAGDVGPGESERARHLPSAQARPLGLWRHGGDIDEQRDEENTLYEIQH